jgi:hypothetical protein
MIIVTFIVCLLIAGLGWSLPAIGIALFLKKLKNVGNKADMEFVFEWALTQGIAGFLTIIGFSVTAFFVSSDIVFKYLFLYFLLSAGSAAIVLALLFRPK